MKDVQATREAFIHQERTSNEILHFCGLFFPSGYGSNRLKIMRIHAEPDPHHWSIAGVLDEPYSQLTPLSGVAVQARQSTVQ